MEAYARENNIPIIEKDSITFIMKYIKLNNVKNILEIGSAIGYSSILMASVSDDIKVTTIERDNSRYMECLKNVKKCDFEKKIDVVLQDALDINLSNVNYDLIFIGHEHNVFTVDNKLYDVGSSGCRKDNTTQYTIFDTETFTVETKSLEYDRTNFEQDLLKENYPDRNLIAKCFFGIEL